MQHDFSDSYIIVLFTLLLSPFVVLGIGSYLSEFLHFLEYLLISILGDKENSSKEIYSYNRKKIIHYHIGIADAKRIFKLYENLPKIKDNDEFLDSRTDLKIKLDALADLYKQLKENLQQNDFQQGGDFFYAQRYCEILSGSKKDEISERPILKIHYMINGFGERFLKPIVFFMVIVVLFAYMQQPNKDYIATESTPIFLYKTKGNLKLTLDKEDTIKIFSTKYLNNKNKENYVYLNKKKLSHNTTSFFMPKLTDDISTRMIFSFSRLYAPFFNQTKQWFSFKTKQAYVLGILESILLWFFLVATTFSIWHRIKR